ncbi:MAG: hypothetical protein JWQ43_3511 [Glaciihabitans sp.]|nr:hypothetical protein [Glaciihabitans sp.]
MIADVISALIGNYMTTCFVIGLIVGVIQILRDRSRRSGTIVTGILLNAYIFWAIGIGQVINFVMHSVFGDFAAKTIGWAQSPFQLELAFSSLGVGVMALILHGRNAQLRGKVAIVIAMAIFAYGAAGGHVYQMIANKDYSYNNTGVLLFMDIFIPTVGMVLVVWHAIARRTQPDPTDLDATTFPVVPVIAPVGR